MHTIGTGTCSSIGASLPVYDLYYSFRISSCRKAWVYKGKVRPERVNFFFEFFKLIRQTLTHLAQPAGHLHAADTTSLYAPCLSDELWQLACSANYVPSIIKGNGWSGATWGRNIFHTSALSWECSSQYIKWSVGVCSVLHLWNNCKQTLHVCKMSPKYNSAYSE